MVVEVLPTLTQLTGNRFSGGELPEPNPLKGLSWSSSSNSSHLGAMKTVLMQISFDYSSSLIH